MAKREGDSSTSSPRPRKKAAKEGRDAREAERGVQNEEEFQQLRREFRQLEGKRAELSEKENELEEQLRSLRREMEQVQRNSLPKRERLEAVCNAREAENAQRLLEKLPQEVWERILDELGENDLFPLAMSCRYFRQKQKELVARTEQNGKPPLALKTTLHPLDVWRNRFKGWPVSAEYLRFCNSTWEVPKHFPPENASYLKMEEVLGFVLRRASSITCPAAYHGHLPLLQELLADSNNWLGRKSLDPSIPRAAALGGQMETLQWLRTHEGFELESRLFGEACQGGHWEILKWLRSEGCPLSEGACAGAAMGGDFEILKWLRSEGCPWDEEACTCAAAGGHLEVLKWLRSEGCPWNEYACTFAAEGGHLEMLKWLRSEGCRWDKQACEYAAKGGHLEMLKWLRSEGCPWDGWTWYWAAESTREWLEENGCPQEIEDNGYWG